MTRIVSKLGIHFLFKPQTPKLQPSKQIFTCMQREILYLKTLTLAQIVVKYNITHFC